MAVYCDAPHQAMPLKASPTSVNAEEGRGPLITTNQGTIAGQVGTISLDTCCTYKSVDKSFIEKYSIHTSPTRRAVMLANKTRTDMLSQCTVYLRMQIQRAQGQANWHQGERLYVVKRNAPHLPQLGKVRSTCRRSSRFRQCTSLLLC